MKNNALIILIIGLAVYFFMKRQKIETNISGINDDYDSLFVKYGKMFRVNPRLMKSIAANESYLGQYGGLEPIGGTRGLMHIKLSTAQDHEADLTEYSLYDSPAATENQVRVATKHMKHLLSLFGGDEKKAVQAYNAGEGNIKKGRIPSTTVAYWDRYQRNFERLG